MTARAARPEVLEVTLAPGRATLELRVQPELWFFPSHFPDHPIVPGVVQLAWALEFAREHLGVAGTVERLTALKFSRVIQPGARVRLNLEAAADGRQLRFELDEHNALCSAGRFALA